MPTRERWPLLAAGLLLVVVLPVLNTLPQGSPLRVSDFTLNLFGKFLAYAILALGIDLIWGYAGVLSLGQGVFFGLGAYGFGLAQLNLVPDLWFCLGAAVVVASAGGAIVAAFISHRRGIYYSLLTIAFGQVFWFIAIKSHTITGGEDGLLKIARLPVRLGVVTFDLTHNISLFYFVLAVFVGFEVISKVPTMLHTPLMSGTNAIHGIVLLGGLLVVGAEGADTLEKVAGTVAVIFGTINIVGGFLVTDRMLHMFKRKPEEKKK